MVTFATVREALGDFFTCLEGAGIDYLDNGTDDSRGFPLPSYGVVLPADNSDATQRLADQCLLIHYDFLDTLYQLQPASVEAAHAPLLAKKAEIIMCLREIGIEVSDEATADDIRRALLWGELGFDPEIGPEGDPPATWVSTNCATTVGLDGY